MPLFYEQHSDLSKQDILFIHGNLASSVWWHPTLKEWKKSGSRGKGSLIFADWRGCGKNPEWPTDQPFSLEDLAQDFLTLLKELGKKEVAVVGHSLGGLIALQMMIADPGCINRAVLLDSVGPKGVVFDDNMYEAFRQMASSAALTQTVILSTIYDHNNLTDELKMQMAKDASKAVKGIGSSVLEILKTVDLTSECTKIKTKTLILHGERDQIIPQADSALLNSLMPNSTLEILPHAGHCWNVEDPEAFTRRLLEWF